MTDYVVTSPDGKKFKITAPEGATQEQALEYAKQQFAQKQERTPTQEAGRQVALGARGLATGAVALPALGADVIGQIMNLGIKAYNASTGSNVQPFQPQGQALEQNLTAAGVPEPETPGERVAYDVNRAAGGAVSTMGAAGAMAPASAVGQGVRQSLTAYPGMQSAAAVSGATASGVTREAGGGPKAQLAAGVLGSVVPSAARDLSSAGVRAAFRGGEKGKQAMAENIKTFGAVGTAPTVGQATEGRIARASESLLSKVPGGAGKMAAKGEAQQAAIGQKADDIASGLSPRADATSAGRAIEKSITGERGFVQQFKDQSGALYNKLDRYIKPHERVDVNSTRIALAKLNAEIPGAPNVSKQFQNSRIKSIEGAVEADTNTIAGPYSQMPAWQKQMMDQLPAVERNAMLTGLVDGKLPYEALKKLRTLVGDQLSDWTIASDVPRSKWKALYGSLSRDLENAAKVAGPNAVEAFTRANKHYSGGIDRIDQLQRVVDKVDFEKIYASAISGSREGATQIRAVMRSMPQEARDVVSATMIKKLGNALPGKQGAEGDVFSTETFLTNWNKLSPEAKIQLFNKTDVRMGLDSIAKVAANIRSGSKVFANPSGTQQAMTLSSGVGGAVLAAMLGKPAVAGGIVAGMGLANGAARLMSKPEFVKWLASDLRKPTEVIPAQIQALIRAQTTPSTQ